MTTVVETAQSNKHTTNNQENLQITKNLTTKQETATIDNQQNNMLKMGISKLVKQSLEEILQQIIQQQIAQ